MPVYVCMSHLLFYGNTFFGIRSGALLRFLGNVTMHNLKCYTLRIIPFPEENSTFFFKERIVIRNIGFI